MLLPGFIPEEFKIQRNPVLLFNNAYFLILLVSQWQFYFFKQNLHFFCSINAVGDL
jgi:hypothetical protein